MSEMFTVCDSGRCERFDYNPFPKSLLVDTILTAGASTSRSTVVFAGMDEEIEHFSQRNIRAVADHLLTLETVRNAAFIDVIQYGITPAIRVLDGKSTLVITFSKHWTGIVDAVTSLLHNCVLEKN